jgi:hypothetical protein
MEMMILFLIIHIDTRRVHCITSEKEEFEIISSSNCLGYIKFDFLCDLKSLVNELYENLICQVLIIVYFMQLVNMIAKDNIWCIEFIFVQI